MLRSADVVGVKLMFLEQLLEPREIVCVEGFEQLSLVLPHEGVVFLCGGAESFQKAEEFHGYEEY